MLHQAYALHPYIHLIWGDQIATLRITDNLRNHTPRGVEDGQLGSTSFFVTETVMVAKLEDIRFQWNYRRPIDRLLVVKRHKPPYKVTKIREPFEKKDGKGKTSMRGWTMSDRRDGDRPPLS